MDLERLRSQFTCLDCIWAEQCAEVQICEGFDMCVELKRGLDYYDAILKENYEEYLLIVEDYSDGN